MELIHRITRLLSTGILIALLGLLAAGSAAGHEVEGTDMPQIASGPSDQTLVHRALEASRQFWEPGWATVPDAQKGCPGYRVTEWDDEGIPTAMDPVFEQCATDRITMYEHAQGPDCSRSYAALCVEQLAPKAVLKRTTNFRMYGVIYRNGQPVPAEKLYLQRRVLGLQDQFVPFRSQRTEEIGEIGSVQLPDSARSKVAYRWGFANAAGEVVYSTVPAVTRVVPRITQATVNRRKVTRQQSFVATARADVGIWGTAKLQYRLGKRWIQVSRVTLTGQRDIRIVGRINRTSGRFPLRLVLTRMTVPGRPWYDAVNVGMGATTVVSKWTIVR